MREQIEQLIADLQAEHSRLIDTVESRPNLENVSRTFFSGRRLSIESVLIDLKAILASNSPENGSQTLESPAIGISEVNK